MDADVVHYLVAGYPLCGFSREVPARWPDNHAWVYEGDPRATCQQCREVAVARAADAEGGRTHG